MAKKYYWLKMKEDFFKQKEIKKLRKLPGGEIYTIIYLKMMLLSLKHEGYIYYDGIEDSFYEEIALEIDEEPISVKCTLGFLLSMGILDQIAEDELFLSRIPECIGKETDKAESMRKLRAKRKEQQLVTSSNNVTQIGNNVTEVLPHVTKRYTEIEIEKELDKEIKNNNVCVSDKKHSKSIADSEQIDAIWSIYPNKKGKATAIKKIPKLIQKYTYEQLERAVNRYKQEIVAKNTAMQYVKHGDTFFNSGYMDYLDENYTEEAAESKFGMIEHKFDYDELEQAADERRKKLVEERQQRIHESQK